MKWLFATLASMTIVASCTSPSISEPISTESSSKGAPNILLIIADDIGVEQLSCYNEANKTAETPNIDRLCKSGLKFSSAWSNPVCTPTRTGMLTGRYGFRTGSLVPTGPLTKTNQYDGTPKMLPNAANIKYAYDNGLISFDDDTPFLRVMRGEKFEIEFGTGPRLDEKTLAKVLQNAGYETAAIGKWHMADEGNGMMDHPNLAGFDHYIGPMFGGVNNYYKFEKWENGVPKGFTNIYATTDTVNDAIDWLQDRGPESPWFMWLAFNAPHDPFHKPPNHLISEQSQKLDENGINPVNAGAYYKAMIEAMDAEIGRLLADAGPAINDNTMIIFVGDNGTPVGLVGAPYPDTTLGKGTLFEGGVNIPMIINGPGVVNGESNAPVHTVDIFATILDFAKVEETPGKIVKKSGKVIDSQSLISVISAAEQVKSNIIYTEIKGLIPTGHKNQKALRNNTYKLMIDETNSREYFYNLAKDPFEQTPLNLNNLTAEAEENLILLRMKLNTLTE